MRRTLHALLIIVICVSTSIAFGQGKRLKVEVENISIKAPENWLAQKTEYKTNGFTVKLYNEQNENHVTINCIKKAMNLEAAIVDASSEKSQKPRFEYMIIEKVRSGKVSKYSGKFLEYTNSPLRDYFRGGFYGILDNGYTYVIDYYSDDTPEGRKEVGNIINSLNILKPEARPNFFQVEKEYLPENVKIEKKVEPVQNEPAIIKDANNKEASMEQASKEEDNMYQSKGIDNSNKEKKSFWKKITSVFSKKEKK